MDEREFAERIGREVYTLAEIAILRKNQRLGFNQRDLPSDQEELWKIFHSAMEKWERKKVRL